MSSHTENFDEVRAAEQEWLKLRRHAAGQAAPDDDVVGLAFSGGGIRSAIFNLGVLQSLGRSGLLSKVDYLSTVSGGGYIGSAFSWLRASLPKDTHAPFDTGLQGFGGSVLDWIRSHGKYLTAHRGFSIWTLLASILASTLVNVLVLGPVLLLAVWAMTLAWLPVQWPDWLALPGATAPTAHHGFWLLLVLGAACLLLFPVVALMFALVAGIPGVSSVHRVNRWRVFMGQLLLGCLVFIAVGLIPVLAKLGEWAQLHFSFVHAQAMGRHFAWLGPLLTGMASMFASHLSKGGTGGGRLATIGVSLIVYGLLVANYLVVTDPAFTGSLWLPLLAGISVVLAFICDVNRVSIHSYYRVRLAESFLAPVEGAASRDSGDFSLTQIGPDKGAPLHLLNTTLNMSNSVNERDRARLGASFTFSPLYAGAQQTGWRRVDDYPGGGMALSTAMTISGAAIDPDMYATNARAVSFLMALLNVRLGYWARNPRSEPGRDPLRPWWWIFLFREMLGFGLDARKRHIHLSDGGGFENLGVYELMRRRLRYVVVCDAGADPELTLSDLGRAIERVRVDFGAEIDLAADSLYHERNELLEKRPWVLGSVRYADGSHGDILYIKPILCAGLSADIYSYWRANPSFPDQPTSEQFFNEPQFEAYRCLGFEIVSRILGEQPPESIPALFERLRDIDSPTAT